ncbi:hypothetical protein Tco_0003544 [Tanacetum coccineum]
MIDCLSIAETDKVIRTVETDIVKLVVEIESFGMSSDEFDKEIGSSDGLQPKQADLSCVHALNELHLHEICVVPNNSEYFHGLVTPFSSIVGQMSGPFSTDSRIIRPCCLFIMYSSILLFQESYISFSNIGGRLSAPERIALSARVVIEKVLTRKSANSVDKGNPLIRLSQRNLHVSVNTMQLPSLVENLKSALISGLNLKAANSVVLERLRFSYNCKLLNSVVVRGCDSVRKMIVVPTNHAYK